MRGAVEFIDLHCTKTLSPSEDDVSLVFHGRVVWTGRIDSGKTVQIGTIKPMARPELDIRLWQTEAASRRTTSLGREKVRQEDHPAGAMTAHFTFDGADYALSYKVLELPE